MAEGRERIIGSPPRAETSLRPGDAQVRRRMRIIALQSAVGGVALSVVGTGFAATENLNLVSGDLMQEVIDELAVLNALHAAFPPKVIHDL